MMNPAAEPIDQPSVLVIDDEAMTRMMATEFMTQAGFQVSEAADGEAALASIDDIDPDLILLDVEMPGMNGFELCAQLRQQPRYALTPILMLTGLNNNEAIDLAYEAGATDFATKPINWSLLCHRLRYMHRASQSAEQLVKNQISLATAQRIAQLGNWEFDYPRQQMIWSEQLYRIFGFEPDEITPSREALLQFVHPGDRDRVEKWLWETGTHRQSPSIDHKIVTRDDSIRNVRQQIEQEFDANGTLTRCRTRF